jgi:hypothetical protein
MKRENEEERKNKHTATGGKARKNKHTATGGKAAVKGAGIGSCETPSP